MTETFRRRKDGEEWVLEMERNIDRNGSSKPRVVRNVRTFGELIACTTKTCAKLESPLAGQKLL